MTAYSHHRHFLLSALLFFLCSLSCFGSHSQQPPLPRHLPAHVANRFCDLMVLYNGRICPLHTLAHDFTVKLTGEKSYRGLSAEQVFTGWIFHFTSWRGEKMIKIKGNDARRALGIDGNQASLSDFFDETGRYRLDNPTKELRDTDEKYNIFKMLYAGQLLKIFPLRNAEGTVMWYSPGDNLPIATDDEKWIFTKKTLDYAHELVIMKDYSSLTHLLEKIAKFQTKEAAEVMPSELRIGVECLYNRFHSTRLFFIATLMVGLLMLVVSLSFTARGTSLPRSITLGMQIFGIAALIWLALDFAMRWIIGAHIPLSNGFDTLLFMALLIAVASLVLQRHYPLVLPLGTLLCGMVMLAAHIAEKNPQITPLMPVLNSPLLSIHVAVIMMAYALFAIVMLNSAAALVMHRFVHLPQAWVAQSAVAGRILLYPAVFLLTAGIFIGAVWANVSWGRYWGWDPKEVWALITMLIYSTALHCKWLRCFCRPVFFHWFALLAFLSVLFTYFGVNYLLGGLHSYGS